MQPIEFETTRHNVGIDPAIEVWEWQVPLYLFLGGAVAGLMVLTSVRELYGRKPTSEAMRLAPFGAFALLSIGLVALLLDLSHKLYVWRFYAAFRVTSPMSWGGWIILFVNPLLMLAGLGALSESTQAWLGERLGPARAALDAVVALARAWRTPVLWATAVLGLGVGVYTGLLLGTTPSRPLWNTAILGPLFLVSGLSSGAAMLLLAPLAPDERHDASRFDLAAMALEVVLLSVYLIGLATGGTAQRHAASVLLGGEWTAPFFALVVFAGLVAPMGFELVELGKHRAFTRMAPWLVLVGGLSLRFILVAAGQEVSLDVH